MPHPHKSTPQALQSLRQVVRDAAELFGTVNEDLSDGDQTARDVLSHLVFWHREYVAVISAIAQERKPPLRVGKFRELNALACHEFKDTPIRVLTKRLIRLQSELETVTVRVNRNSKLTFKAGAQKQRIGYWLPRIQAHIAGHLMHLRQIHRRIERST